MNKNHEILIVRYLDGTATSEEIRLLDDLAGQDQGVRRALLLDAAQDAEIREVLREELAPASLSVSVRRKAVSKARPGRRVSWTRWISIAACLAIITGALVYNAHQQERFVEVLVAHIKATAPNVRIIRRGETIIAVVDMGILAGDRITTRNGQRVRFVYERERTEILIDENTMLDVGGVEKGKRLDVRAGKIDCSVSPQIEDRPMIVTTPQAKAHVKGTVFSLAVDTGATRIDVLEGLVAFTKIFDGSSVEVAVGHYAIASDDLDLKALPIEEPVVEPVPVGQPLRSDGRYVEGDVVFEDDFEQGLEKWNVIVANAEDPNIMQLARGPERDAVRIVEVQRDGKTTRMVEMDGTMPAIGGRRVGLHPRDLKIDLVYVLEYDGYFAMDKDFGAISFHGSRLPANRWMRMRTESVLTERSGLREQLRTILVNGKKLGVYRDPYSENRSIQIIGAMSVLRVDNVVIRQVIPLRGGDGEK